MEDNNAAVERAVSKQREPKYRDEPMETFYRHWLCSYVTTAKSWLESVANKIRALAAVPPAPPSIPEREKVLADALRGMLAEWDKFTRYGSPLAKAANENVNRAKAAIAALEGK